MAERRAGGRGQVAGGRGRKLAWRRAGGDGKGRRQVVMVGESDSRRNGIDLDQIAPRDMKPCHLNDDSETSTRVDRQNASNV